MQKISDKMKLVLSLVIVFIILEGSIRFIVGQPPLKTYPQLTREYHPTRGFMSPANYNGYSLEAPISLNARGFRAPLPREISVDDQVIVGVGGSLLFSQGVARQHSFPYLLSSNSISYINLGVPGYDTDQCLLVLEEEGWDYHPDAIHFHFFITQLLKNALPETFVNISSEPRQDPFKGIRHSALITLIGKKWKSSQDPHHPIRRALRMSDPPGILNWEDLWEGVFNSLQQLAAICQSHQTPLRVIIHPIMQQKPQMLERYQSILCKFLTSLDINYLDLRPRLTTNSWIPMDGHYNRKGHQQVARAIREHFSFPFIDG